MLIESYSKKNKLLDNVKKEIAKLDALCITPEEKEQRIQEIKQLNRSIAYASTMIQFFWKQDTMVSYVRDQHYTIIDMLGIPNYVNYIPRHCSLKSSQANKFHQSFHILANFGGVMGCAIGMSLASACELIYWLTLKPVAKWMVRNDMALTTRANYVYKMTYLLVFLAWLSFSYYQFHNVYLAYRERAVEEDFFWVGGYH